MQQKITVLIIEDEKSICDFMAKTLNTNDYKTITTGSGKEGMAILTSALPDLVLLDLGLPDMDGIDVIKQTREWSSIPIIVISARVQEKGNSPGRRGGRLYHQTFWYRRTPGQDKDSHKAQQ